MAVETELHNVLNTTAAQSHGTDKNVSSVHIQGGDRKLGGVRHWLPMLDAKTTTLQYRQV